MAHAYLVVGDEGLGQEAAVNQVVAALLCASPGTGTVVCGTCPSCRKLAADNHPDVSRVRPDGATLKTEQVAAVLRDLRYRPLEGERRVVVLYAADLMSDEAANRLLKTLEEPPPGAVLILVADDARRLPPTIVSRCQLVPFRPLPEAKLMASLIEQLGLTPERARKIARLARGNLGRASELAAGDLAEKLQDRVNNVLTEIASGDSLTALAASEQLASLEAPQRLWTLDILELTLRDLWLGNRQSKSPADAWAGLDLEAAVTHICVARQRLAGNVSPQSTFDALLLALQGCITVKVDEYGRNERTDDRRRSSL